jgi:hypothetical protein
MARAVVLRWPAASYPIEQHPATDVQQRPLGALYAKNAGLSSTPIETIAQQMSDIPISFNQGIRGFLEVGNTAQVDEAL